MSVNRSNEWKVGAFVVGGVIAAVATLFWLGAARFNSETIERVTFLDESVQGLEVGAPVKVRGGDDRQGDGHPAGQGSAPGRGPRQPARRGHEVAERPGQR